MKQGNDPLFEKLLALAPESDEEAQEFLDFCWDSLWLGDDEMDEIMGNSECRKLLESDIPILYYHWMTLSEGGGLYDKALTEFQDRFTEDEIQEMRGRLAGLAGFFRVRELFPGENQVLVEDILTSDSYRLFDRKLSHADSLGLISAGLIVNHPDGTRSALHPFTLIAIPGDLQGQVAEKIREEFKEENLVRAEEGDAKLESISAYIKANLEVIAHITQWVLYETQVRKGSKP